MTVEAPQVAVVRDGRTDVTIQGVGQTDAGVSSQPNAGVSSQPEVTWLRPPTRSFEVRFVGVMQHTTVVCLRGEIDAHTAPRVCAAVDRAFDLGARAIVIDLSEVSFIDAAGLGVIVVAARRRGPGAVAVVCPHRSIVRVFRICGLDRLLDLYDNCEQAVHRLPA